MWFESTVFRQFLMGFTMKIDLEDLVPTIKGIVDSAQTVENCIKEIVGSAEQVENYRNAIGEIAGIMQDEYDSEYDRFYDIAVMLSKTTGDRLLIDTLDLFKPTVATMESHRVTESSVINKAFKAGQMNMFMRNRNLFSRCDKPVLMNIGYFSHEEYENDLNAYEKSVDEHPVSKSVEEQNMATINELRIEVDRINNRLKELDR